MRPCAYLQEIQLVLLRDLPKTLPSFRQASQHQKTKCNFTKELWSRMPRIAARMEYFMAQAPERESQFIWSKFKKWKLMSWRNVFMYKLPMYHSLSWSTCEVDLRCHWKKPIESKFNHIYSNSCCCCCWCCCDLGYLTIQLPSESTPLACGGTSLGSNFWVGGYFLQTPSLGEYFVSTLTTDLSRS